MGSGQYMRDENGNLVEEDAPEGLSPEMQEKLDEIKGSTSRQVGGDHYKKLGDYQPWEVLARWLTEDELRGFGKGTAIAYLARECDKGGRQDIEKAMHTLQLYLELSGRDRKEALRFKEAPQGCGALSSETFEAARKHAMEVMG